MKRVYVSGVLTGVDNLNELKKFYEEIAEVCSAAGMEAYVPHLYSDPVKNPQMTPREVYVLDRQRVSESDLVIAYAGAPSLGVGQEIEIARENELPVVLLMEKNAVISRMARGNPAVIAEIRFTDFQDALLLLAKWLQEWKV